MRNHHFAVWCELSGRIRSVIHDDLGLLNSDLTTPLLSAMVTTSSVSACFTMLEAVRQERLICGWLIEVQSEDGPVSLHFAGAVEGERILLIGSEDLNEMPRFIEKLAERDNGHSATFRGLINKVSGHADRNGQHDSFTELNNSVTALQRQLAARTRELEAALRERNLLMGFAAHDLRGPISAVRNFASVLSRSQNHNDAERRCCQWIERLSGYMAQLVTGVLSVTAIEAGELRLKIAECELRQVIRTAVECALPMAEISDVRIEIAKVAAEETQYCQLDQIRMVQAIVNLLDNAVKASPPGSAVVVTTDVRNSTCRITVRDNGSGIPINRREQIFEAFKTDSVDSLQSSSVGLGLAITRRIVHEHKGQIEVECPSDGGTVFHVVIPQSPTGCEN